MYPVGSRPWALAADGHAVYAISRRRIVRHDKTTGKNKSHNIAPSRFDLLRELPDHHWVWACDTSDEIVLFSCRCHLVGIRRNDANLTFSLTGAPCGRLLDKIAEVHARGRHRLLSDPLPAEQQPITLLAGVAAAAGHSMRLQLGDAEPIDIPPMPPDQIGRSLLRRPLLRDQFDDLTAEIPADEPQTLKIGSNTYHLPWAAVAVAFSVDGLTVVVSSEAGEVQEWDVA